jgi:hypothetical protein
MAKQSKVDLKEHDNACVRCHGIVVTPDVQQLQFDPKHDGVTCVVCHGAFQEWIQEHQFPNNPKWRKLTRTEKEQLKGMKDLWDPKTRVETCLSCHVGDPHARKILTHEMYAAGHPPLPGIEVATFSDLQPRHWQYLREKTPENRKLLGFHKDRMEQTELVAVSGLSALRKSLEMLTTRPGGEKAETGWPDFALYDCAACHHDLRVSDLSWRQDRNRTSLPGRPSPPVWPLALLHVGLEAADPERADSWFDSLQRSLRVFDAAMTEKPFGNLEKATPLAREIIRSLDEPLSMLEKKARARPDTNDPIVNRDTAMRMLRRLGKIAAETIADHESARQMVWAFRTIYQELVLLDPKIQDKKTMAILDRIDHRLGSNMSPGDKTVRRPVMDSLADRLKAASEYTPRAFREDFAQLLEHLPG